MALMRENCCVVFIEINWIRFIIYERNMDTYVQKDTKHVMKKNDFLIRKYVRTLHTLN